MAQQVKDPALSLHWLRVAAGVMVQSLAQVLLHAMDVTFPHQKEKKKKKKKEFKTLIDYECKDTYIMK